MKKFLIKTISLLLALVLLCGCGADDATVSYVYEYEYVPKQLIAERIDFEDIEYLRPDMDALYELVFALEDALQSRHNLEEICSLIDYFNAGCTSFATMYSVANIRACMDLTDEFYDEELSWCMAAEAELQMLMDELYLACANSEYAQWLEENIFWDGFCEEYRLTDDVQSDGSYGDYIALTEREAELLSRYRDIVSGLSVELDGRDLDFEEAQSRDYEGAYAAYYEKYNPILAELYIELIGLRQVSAALMGFESYADYAYAYIYGRDFGPEEALEYLSLIKKHMGGLFHTISDIGITEELMYDPVDEWELELYLETLTEGFGGEVAQAYELMKQYGMYDLAMSPDKAEKSFVDYLELYNIPFLFLGPYGYTDDIMTMCHEFGHYVDGFIREGAYESIDLAEVYSQAMQLLGIEQLHCVMTAQEHKNFVDMNLMDIVSSLQFQSALAEFELRSYEMESPTVEKLNELYMEIAGEYGLHSAEEDFDSRGWIEIPHLFESPFYVISYSVSAPAALGLYEMELDKAGSGIECFVKMSESGLAGLEETMEFVGIQAPLSESRVRETATFLSGRLVL